MSWPFLMIPESRSPRASPDSVAINTNVQIREVQSTDVARLDVIERAVFDSDRLSVRRFRHWVKAPNRVFLVAQEGDELLGYGLVLLHRGTRLARLYSLAVDPAARGRGVGRKLVVALELATQDTGRLYMRLEVATDNLAAIHLYESLGYRPFGQLSDYYEDHRDALRMQKRIRYISENLLQRDTPWYRQTTDFTCGPASLLMAMESLDNSRHSTQEEELDIWREATTIFMTSGHGGCHPLGLALAAHNRGFSVTAYVNQKKPLFLEGVRSTEKKQILKVVDNQFQVRARKAGIRVRYRDVSQENIARWLKEGCAVIMLISTYRMDGKKAPHWVTVSGIDDKCLYVHDPDPATEQNPIDCQYVPIARDDFARMSSFGSERLRTCVVIKGAGK